MSTDNQMLRAWDRHQIANTLLDVMRRRSKLHGTQAPRPMSRFAKLFWPPRQYEIMQNLQKAPTKVHFQMTTSLEVWLPTRLGDRKVGVTRGDHVAVYFEQGPTQTSWHPAAIAEDREYVVEFLRWSNDQAELLAEEHTANRLLEFVRSDIKSSGQVMHLMGTRLLNVFTDGEIGRRLAARKGKPYRTSDMPEHLQGKQIRESFDWLMTQVTPGLFIDSDIKTDNYWRTEVDIDFPYSPGFSSADTPEGHMQKVAEALNASHASSRASNEEFAQRNIDREAETTRNRLEWQPD